MTALVKLFDGAGFEISGSIPVGVDWRKQLELMPGRGEVDAIIVNGEGSIHRSRKRARARFLPQLAAYAEDELGIPAFLVNSTLYKIEKPELACIARFDRSFVRDSASLALLARAGINSTIVPDLSISNSFPSPHQRAGILVTDSVVRKRRCFLREYAQRNRLEFLPMGRIHYEDGEVLPSLEAFVHKIARSRLVVTGRYHVACICLATKTPFIAIESNSPKISFVCIDVLGSRRRIWSQNQIAGTEVYDYAEWNAQEQRRLALFGLRAQHAAQSMVACIRDRITMRA